MVVATLYPHASQPGKLAVSGPIHQVASLVAGMILMIAPAYTSLAHDETAHQQAAHSHEAVSHTAHGSNGHDHSEAGQADGHEHEHEHGRDVPSEWMTRPNPLPLDDETLANGRQIYEQFCSACHGPSGQGDGFAPTAADFDPSPTNLALHGPGHSPGEYAWVIQEGNPASAMPSFGSKLSENEIWSVVHYIHHGLAEGQEEPHTHAHQH